MTDASRTEFKIPEPNLLRLAERVAALNKRAAKLGVAPVVLDSIGREETLLYCWADRAERLTPEHPEDRPSRVRVTILVRVTGETPKLAGWAFLATLDHASEAGVVLRVVPGAEVPESYRTALPLCDHCRTIRNRRETFVVRHEDGTLKQVGRDCLVDFLGGADPKVVAAWCELLGAFRADLGASEDEGWGGGGGGAAYFYLPEYLAMVAATIEKEGWVSRTAARAGAGGATADSALGWLIPPLGGWTAGDLKRRPEVTDAHRDLATRAIDWTAGLREAKPALSDYEHNLVVVCGTQALTPKNAGIAASVIPAYKREVEREILGRRRAAAGAAFVGTIGARAEFTVEVVNVIEYEGNFGVTRIHKMLDDAGNALVWFASRAGGLAQGRRYRIKATVKAHEDDAKWGKQTVLTRAVKLAEIEESAAEVA